MDSYLQPAMGGAERREMFASCRHTGYRGRRRVSTGTRLQSIDVGLRHRSSPKTASGSGPSSMAARLTRKDPRRIPLLRDPTVARGRDPTLERTAG